MTNRTLHCVNVILPRNYGARTHSVALKLVLATSADEALRKVAADCSDDELISYRNEFDADEVTTWSYQTWSRLDVEHASVRKARSIAPVSARARARFWEDVVPYFKLDTSFDYEAAPEVLLGYLKAYERAMEA